MKKLSIFLLSCAFFISIQASQDIPLTPRTINCLNKACIGEQLKTMSPMFQYIPDLLFRGMLIKNHSKPDRILLTFSEETNKLSAVFTYTDMAGEEIKLIANPDRLKSCFASHENPNKLQELTQLTRDHIAQEKIIQEALDQIYAKN